MRTTAGSAPGSLIIPRIVIAGTHSGCGKTTVATGLMSALAERGLVVQPFKVGPDFIDPSHHTRICGRPSRNLDPFMMGEAGVRDSFARATAGADIAVIEGVMGLYDGLDGTDTSSTAHVARILSAPVILVVDVKGMSRSVHAIIGGYRHYDPTIAIGGVILNRTGSARHRGMIEPGLGVPALGWIPKSDEIAVKSRHLGLVMGHESGSLGQAGRIIAAHCDLEAILALAATAPPFAVPAGAGPENRGPVRARIGIALDDAFCFYYQDNLDLLARCGAELVFFSPIAGHMPAVDAVYLGGGYPELHAAALEKSPCTAELKKAAEDGMPVFGECGGLMYLSRGLFYDREYRFCGVLPAEAEMTRGIQALGYVRGTSRPGHPWLGDGTVLLGHEFHYSRVNPDHDARFVFGLSRGKGISDGEDGLVAGHTVGTYTHSYFSREFADAFVRMAATSAGK